MPPPARSLRTWPTPQARQPRELAHDARGSPTSSPPHGPEVRSVGFWDPDRWKEVAAAHQAARPGPSAAPTPLRQEPLWDEAQGVQAKVIGRSRALALLLAACDENVRARVLGTPELVEVLVGLRAGCVLRG